MTHYMKLNPQPFKKIACGDKTIELRLNDEKRQLVKKGDIIVFTNLSDTSAQIRTKVIKLHLFSSFSELYKSLPLQKCGYTPEDMDKYYSAERQKQYGVLGIEIELVNKNFPPSIN